MGMIAEHRKPLLVLAASGVVAVLVLVLGIGLGRRDSGGVGGWQQRLSGAASPTVLRPADLSRSAGSCALEDDHITVSGECTFTVQKNGGAFSLTGATREAKVSVSGFPVLVSVIVDDRRIAQDLSPGDGPVRLTFGRDGGVLQFACGLGPCVVAFAEGDS